MHCQMDLSIIIVSWNVREALERNLACLFLLSDVVMRDIVVIDNASADGTASMVRERFPDVSLIENDWNAGFAFAVNQGIRLSHGRHILLLNPDMLVREGSLGRLVERLESQDDLGILGVRLESRDGSVIPSVRRDPALTDQLAIALKLPHVFSSVLERYTIKNFDASRSQDVEQVRGSFFAFRREVAQLIGPFDEGFFLWFEEVDYCRRVREAGFRVHFAADIVAEDLVGRSFAQVSTRRKQWIFTKSQRRYFKKWHGWGPYVVLMAATPIALFAGVLEDMRRSVIAKRSDV